MVNRWVVVFACAYVAFDQFTGVLERLTPGYVPTYWWEAPWWLMMASAAFWLLIAAKVWKGEVK